MEPQTNTDKRSIPTISFETLTNGLKRSPQHKYDGEDTILKTEMIHEDGMLRYENYTENTSNDKVLYSNVSHDQTYTDIVREGQLWILYVYVDVCTWTKQIGARPL